MSPINQQSEVNRRRLQAECVLLGQVSPADPTEHAGSGRGGPVAWMLIAILVVVACSLLLLVKEWIAAGGWLR